MGRPRAKLPPPKPIVEVEPPLAEVLLHPRVLKELGRSCPGFNRAGLLADLFNEWGRKRSGNGQAAFAATIFEEFEASKPGSVARQRLLDCICRLINWHSDSIRDTPVEEMSEAELVAAITASLPRLGALASTPEPREPEV